MDFKIGFIIQKLRWRREVGVSQTDQIETQIFHSLIKVNWANSTISRITKKLTADKMITTSQFIEFAAAVSYPALLSHPGQKLWSLLQCTQEESGYFSCKIVYLVIRRVVMIRVISGVIMIMITADHWRCWSHWRGEEFVSGLV